MFEPHLPIHDAITPLKAALAAHGIAVLQAPPGAGKTTIVPLAILDNVDGRILMLEPRRLAARSAAMRMAELLGEDPGQTVGYIMRGDRKLSASTRIVVVTEGVLTRMIQDDPELTGISVVIFDEFHERSLNADLGLALTTEARAALRGDLQIIVMSATLDVGPLASLLGAPVVTSQGRAYPVETIWLDRPLPPDADLSVETAKLAQRALGETTGGLLVFLPGQREIERTAARLEPHLPPDCSLHKLYGALPFTQQRAAIAKEKSGRKIVLATSIAETSLTIEDITTVVDAGKARRARFDAASGMGRLVTEPVSRAEADQRRGRAGRLTTGHCYRLWTKAQEGALPAHAPAEIESTDLAPLALQLALWGNPDGSGMAFLTPPPTGPMSGARALLRDLGALDQSGTITAHGRKIAATPLHPRLAHMLVIAGSDHALTAALLAARDPLRNQTSADLALRIKALKNDGNIDARRGDLAQIRQEAKRLERLAPEKDETFSLAEAAALAYPDRIGMRRPGNEARYLLSGGRGCFLHSADDLATAHYIVATDLADRSREALVRQAVAITEGEIRSLFSDRITTRNSCEWDQRKSRITATTRELLGALTLSEVAWKSPPREELATAQAEAIRALGIPKSRYVTYFQARVAAARDGGYDLPDVSDHALLENIESWLIPFCGPARSRSDFEKIDVFTPLKNYVGWDDLARLDEIAPSAFTTPLGREIPIVYKGDTPAIEVRLQEMLGVSRHPTAAGKPIQITLLSPAHRPIQTSSDLPGFWASSYTDVRKDMRGRYPKHDWPEDPANAKPTLRAKPRKA